MEYIRSFLAIEIMQAILENISKIQDELKKELSLVKWLKPEDMHLTLLFLGNISLMDVDKINNVLLAPSLSTKPFYIKLKSIGIFPNSLRPRVLWIGVEDRHKNMESLYDDILRPLEKIGFKGEDRKFHPHLTLGRFKSIKGNKILNSYLEKYKNFEFGEELVDKIVLFKSDLRPDGSVYTKLKEISIGGDNVK